MKDLNKQAAEAFRLWRSEMLRQGQYADATKSEAHRAGFLAGAGELTKLQAFKDFVHRRLDEGGIPTHPDGEHSKAGCRIGDRLDIVLSGHAELTRLRERVAELEGGWISVKDRLPEIKEFSSDSVLICVKENAKRIIILASWDGDDWMSECSFLLDDEPTHWMPKPSLPSQG